MNERTYGVRNSEAKGMSIAILLQSATPECLSSPDLSCALAQKNSTPTYEE